MEKQLSQLDLLPEPHRRWAFRLHRDKSPDGFNAAITVTPPDGHFPYTDTEWIWDSEGRDGGFQKILVFRGKVDYQRFIIKILDKDHILIYDYCDDPGVMPKGRYVSSRPICLKRSGVAAFAGMVKVPSREELMRAAGVEKTVP